MKCYECRHDNPAGARFCLECGADLPVRCLACGGDLPATAKFCMHCGQPMVTSTPADDARLSRLAAATPDPLARKLCAARELAGERRLVTVLFADVVGSTELASELGSRAWMKVTNNILDRVIAAIYRYEGTIARLLADSVWAFFGAPLAHEDDPVRAVRAGLDLLDAARDYAGEVQREYGVDLALRVCLNTGLVVVGAVGDDLRYEYAASSPTVNLAARLKFVARPRSLLISQHTHRFIAPLFDTEEVGDIEVKGGEPVRVYQVHAARSAPGRVRGLSGAGLESPMVGRDAELASLLRLCEAVRARLGRATLIIGEAGLGKTRLIAEWQAALAEEPDGGRFLWAEGHCLSYGQGLAYHLLIDLVRSLLGVPEAAGDAETRAALKSLTEDLFGAAGDEVYPYLGHLLSVRLEEEAASQVRLLDPQALQAQYLAAMGQFLGALAACQPVILVLEDLHWADPSSTDLLIRLLPLVSSAPVLLCMTTRPEHAAPAWRLVTAARERLAGSLTEIALRTLSESDSRQLVANLLDIELLPESMRAMILDKAEGNPFFVEEVIRMFIDQGAIIRRGEDWVAGAGIEEIEIPDNLHSLLLARIDRLPEDVRHTLRVAAVIGRQFPVKVLQYVVDEGRVQPLTRHLTQLEHAGLILLAQITPDLQYRFRHSLIQDASYQSLLRSDCQRLHRAVGRAIEALYPDRLDEYAAMLARHFHQAGDHRPAGEYYLRAGDAALASYANREAENHFRQALDLSESDLERAGLLSRLGQALLRQDCFEEGMAVLRQAIKLSRSLGDLEAVADLYARLGRAASTAEGPPESLRICLEGLATTAGAAESSGLARLLHETARAHFFGGDAIRAEPLCRQALEMAERQGAAPVRADALATLGLLPQLASEERLSALRQAAELAEAEGLLAIAARAHNNLGVQIQRIQENTRASLHHFGRAAELHRKRGVSALPLSTSYLMVGYGLLALGDLASTEELLASAVELTQGLPDPESVQHALDSGLAFLAAFKGEFDSAMELYRRAQSASLARGEWQWVYHCSLGMADVLLAVDRHQPVERWGEAEAALRGAIQRTSAGLVDRPRLHCALSAVYARQGRLEEARRALADAEREAAPDLTAASRVALRRAELELAMAEGQWATALEAVEEIAAFHLQREHTPYWAESLETRAEIHLRRGRPGDPELAHVLLRQAHDTYQELDLPIRAAQIERRLVALRSEAFARARDHDTATHELAVAGRIQAGLLPEILPTIPGWEVAAALEPARETSGDFYDFVPLPDGCLGVVVADVADKGAGAALYMALTRTLLRSAADLYPQEPGRVLVTVNERILAETHTDMFVTVFYAVLDPDRGTIVYANGGHNPGYLFQSGDSHPLRGTGMALGVLPDTAWSQETIRLDKGDTLLLYTDGAIDARTPEGEPFGLERLLTTAQAHLERPATGIQAAILAEIHQFVGDAPRFDDLTLVVVACP